LEQHEVKKVFALVIIRSFSIVGNCTYHPCLCIFGELISLPQSNVLLNHRTKTITTSIIRAEQNDTRQHNFREPKIGVSPFSQKYYIGGAYERMNFVNILD